MQAAKSKINVPAATLEALMDAAKAVLAADSLDETFGQIARRLGDLVPYDDLVIYEVDALGARLAAVFADGAWVDEVMAESFPIEEGITGHALRERRVINVARSDLDPRSRLVAGTVEEPEAMVSVPLVVEGRTIAALNVYRLGDDVAYSEREAEVIERFAAMAALAFNSARQREQLRAQARSDALTGLLDHRAAHERLTEEISRAKREREELGVVLIDLDGFKAINDGFGHAEGDRVLRAVAERLREAVRAEDVVARVGGEEFALVLPATGPGGALEAADRARAAIAGVDLIEDGLTASAGVAIFPSNGATAAELLAAADAALYAAKRSGRDRTCTSP